MITTTCGVRTVFTLTVLTPSMLLPNLSMASSQEAHLSVPHLFQSSFKAAPSRPIQRHSAHNAAASSVTGTYDGPHSGTLDVLELPEKRIRFDLMVLQDVPPSQGADQGEASGVVILRNGVSVYHVPVDADNPNRGGGKLTMRFGSGKVHISEEGDMNFGLGVTAEGTYIRHSRKPPKFNKDGQAI